MTFEVITSSPVAAASNDHKVPLGTINDNTRCPRFVAACERVFRKPLRFMDLGCAGGGLVLDFLLRGHGPSDSKAATYHSGTCGRNTQLPHSLFHLRHCQAVPRSTAGGTGVCGVRYHFGMGST